MLSAMRKLGLLLACLIYTGYGRRVRESIPDHADLAESHEPSRALTNLLLASNPEAGFQPSGPGPRLPSTSKSHPAVANPLKKLTSSLSAAALAAAVALTSNVDLAAAEEVIQSPFAKVDKTGPIGAIASVVEEGIDLTHNLLVGAGLTNTYGISICLFTILLRTLTLPLTITQLTTSAKMQQMQPLQKKINAAFPKPGDAAQKNQYMAQLYQSADVNPLAGCLPAFAQIPIFLSLYRALTNLEAEQKLNEPFLWIPNLEGPVYGAPPGNTLEWVKSAFTGSPKLGWEDTLAFLSLPLILVISQTISSRLMQPQKDPDNMTEQELQTQQITTFLPFIVAFFSLNVPSGLAIYWIASNVLTTVYTVLVRKSIKEEGLTPEAQRIMDKIDIKLNTKPKEFTPLGLSEVETRRSRKKKITYVIDTDSGASKETTKSETATATIDVEATPVESSADGDVRPASKPKGKKKKKGSKKKSKSKQ